MQKKLRNLSENPEEEFPATTLSYPNLVPRTYVSFDQRQDTELWDNQLPKSKNLGLPVSRHMRALA